MSRYRNRLMTTGVAGAFLVALAVAGGVPAGAAPASGTVASIQAVDGVWLTSLAGVQAGEKVALDPVSALAQLKSGGK